MDLYDPDLMEPVGNLPAIDFPAGRLAAIDGTPLSEGSPEVISVPEAPVEDFGEGIFQRGSGFRGESPVADRVGGLPVAGGAAADIVCAPCPAFDFEDPDSGVDDFVHEIDGAEVFRGHYVFVVDDKLLSGLKVPDLVAAAADLHASTPVRRGAG